MQTTEDILSRKFQHKIDFKVTTLTPVSIGDGGIKSQLIDYHLGEEGVHFIDEDKLSEALQENGLTDKFMEGILNVSNKNTTNYVSNFLKDNNTIIEIESLYKDDIAISFFAPDDVSPNQLSTILKNSNQEPYLSGSTIKGAIATVFMYDWLKNTDEGEMKLRILLSTHLKKNKEDFQKEFNKLYRGCFELDKKDNETPPVFAKLKVRDSNPIAESLGIYHVERISVKDESKSIPITREAIMPNSSADCQILIDKSFPDKHQSIDTRLKSVSSLPSLIKLINSFTKTFVEREINLLNNEHIKNNLYAKHLKEFYEDKIEPLSKRDDLAVFSLGFGKGYFMNSIGLAMNKTNLQDALEKMGVMKEGQKVFPVTKSIFFLDNDTFLPPGWVIVSGNDTNISDIVQTISKESKKQTPEINNEGSESTTKTDISELIELNTLASNSIVPATISHISNKCRVLIKTNASEIELDLNGFKKNNPLRNNPKFDLDFPVMVQITQMKEGEIIQVKYVEK
jgi:CRISPR-associated protein Csm5